MAPVQPSASVAATGLGIRYIGDHCLGFSGQIALANDSVDQFNFTSGSGYMDMIYNFGFNYSAVADSKNIGFTISLNSIEIMEMITELKPGAGRDLDVTTPFYFLIPPFTNVIIQGTTNDAGINVYGVLRGRVYGAE